jgi:hypothetical protein
LTFLWNRAEILLLTSDKAYVMAFGQLNLLSIIVIRVVKSHFSSSIFSFPIAEEFGNRKRIAVELSLFFLE